MIKYTKKIAISLAESLIAITMLGVLFAITAYNVTNIMSDNNVARFKKSYAAIEKSVAALINDTAVYGTIAGFRETSKVTLDKIGEVLGQKPEYKFRDAMRFSLDVVKDNIKKGDLCTKSSSGCFMTDDGTVWEVPDTDFDSRNVIHAKDEDGDDITLVPITLYVNYKEKDETQTRANSGIVVGIRYNGIIKLIKDDKCEPESEDIRCKLDKYVKATSIKKRDDED